MRKSKNVEVKLAAVTPLNETEKKVEEKMEESNPNFSSDEEYTPIAVSEEVFFATDNNLSPENKFSFTVLGITPNTGNAAIKINGTIYETNTEELKGMARHIISVLNKSGY